MLFACMYPTLLLIKLSIGYPEGSQIEELAEAISSLVFAGNHFHEPWQPFQGATQDKLISTVENHICSCFNEGLSAIQLDSLLSRNLSFIM
jgi:hypothetical protein